MTNDAKMVFDLATMIAIMVGVGGGLILGLINAVISSRTKPSLPLRLFRAFYVSSRASSRRGVIWVPID